MDAGKASYGNLHVVHRLAGWQSKGSVRASRRRSCCSERALGVDPPDMLSTITTTLRSSCRPRTGLMRPSEALLERTGADLVRKPCNC